MTQLLQHFCNDTAISVGCQLIAKKTLVVVSSIKKEKRKTQNYMKQGIHEAMDRRGLNLGLNEYDWRDRKSKTTVRLHKIVKREGCSC